jgi:hypothetical protein
MINIRWLWLPLISGSLFLAIPGNSTLRGILGDIIGHFFSAALLAIVPIVGYRLMYHHIGEKEMTYIFTASWIYLVLSRFFS